jgi:hypothetical protein
MKPACAQLLLFLSNPEDFDLIPNPGHGNSLVRGSSPVVPETSPGVPGRLPTPIKKHVWAQNRQKYVKIVLLFLFDIVVGLLVFLSVVFLCLFYFSAEMLIRGWG